ncbi:hypothetical protein TrRE_jg1953, partial [Triparma retinervis]
ETYNALANPSNLSFSTYPASPIFGPSYSSDVSFPTHNLQAFLRSTSLGPLPLSTYSRHINGCLSAYSKASCESSEILRSWQNEHQPKAMLNFTAAGYLKARLPPAVYGRLRGWYERNEGRCGKREAWGEGNTFVNHWESETTMVS